MRIQQEGFTILDQPVGIFQIGFALANGFDLGTAQSYAGLELLQQEVVMAGGAIHGGISGTGGDRIAFLDFLRGSLLRASLQGMAGLPGHRRKSYPNIDIRGPLPSHGSPAVLCYNPASASLLS